MTELLHAELTYQLRGLGFRIHNELRGGHEEAVYETALAYAMAAADIPFVQQPVFRIDYRNQQVGEYRPDFLVNERKVLLELKAAPVIEALHKAQAISYLAVTGADLGLIMNFGAPSMQFERIPNFLGQRVMEVGTSPISGGDDLLYPDLCNGVVNAMMHVHSSLGPGFLHQVYRRAARIELEYRMIRHAYVKELPLRYDGHVIKMMPVRIFLIEEKLLLATVAMQTVSPAEEERLRWAMRLVGVQLGLIANFYGTTLTMRFVRVKEKTTTDLERNG